VLRGPRASPREVETHAPTAPFLSRQLSALPTTIRSVLVVELATWVEFSLPPLPFALHLQAPAQSRRFLRQSLPSPLAAPQPVLEVQAFMCLLVICMLYSGFRTRRMCREV
jgi:hypothetical protein